MKFSIKTIFVALLVVAAFCAGWILTPPSSMRRLTPVLVAVGEIPSNSILRESDFRTVYRDISEVPDLAAREYADIEKYSNNWRIRANGHIFVDELWPSKALRDPAIPPGKQVCALKVRDLDDFTLYLLGPDDVVSISQTSADGNSKVRTCLIPRCTVFAVGKAQDSAIVSVLVTEPEADSVYKAQKNGMQLSFERPEN